MAGGSFVASLLRMTVEGVLLGMNRAPLPYRFLLNTSTIGTPSCVST
jgi:hypothetical protein